VSQVKWDTSHCLLTALLFLPRDAQCGKLQCQDGEQSPLVPHVVPVTSTIRLEGREVTCRGALALPAAQLNLLDLGLVEPGTQCGPRMVSSAHPTPSGHFSFPGHSVPPTHCQVGTLPIGVPGQALPECYLSGAGTLPNCLPQPWGE
jgi:hypothetical protein